MTRVQRCMVCGLRVSSVAEKLLVEDPVPGQGLCVLCSAVVLLQLAAQRKAQLRPGEGGTERQSPITGISVFNEIHWVSGQ